MNKSIRISPAIMEICKKQLMIAEDTSFTLHALKPDTFLSEFEDVQKSFKQLSGFASKWESSVSTRTENKYANDGYVGKLWGGGAARRFLFLFSE
ncbi:hypothetical protein [Paenibacillus sp. MBLB4367]|uniref:hypothetical protein n=1 Tax=Paenibacillus sp. MBLB4367 TaxID=3384767 RepID=UPI0039081E80